MPSFPKHERKLSWSEKFTRLRGRLIDSEWRRYFKLLFAGKAMGIALVLGIICVTSIFIGGQALADGPEVKAADIVNPINTVWTLVAAFPGVQSASRIHDAGSGLLPLTRNS